MSEVGGSYLLAVRIFTPIKPEGGKDMFAEFADTAQFNTTGTPVPAAAPTAAPPAAQTPPGTDAAKPAARPRQSRPPSSRSPLVRTVVAPLARITQQLRGCLHQTVSAPTIGLKARLPVRVDVVKLHPRAPCAALSAPRRGSTQAATSRQDPHSPAFSLSGIRRKWMESKRCGICLKMVSVIRRMEVPAIAGLLQESSGCSKGATLTRPFQWIDPGCRTS